jgi:small-conductance mechanosensitive channel
MRLPTESCMIGGVEGELNIAIIATLRQRGVAIPFPRREVRLISGSA